MTVTVCKYSKKKKKKRFINVAFCRSTCKLAGINTCRALLNHMTCVWVYFIVLDISVTFNYSVDRSELHYYIAVLF